MGLRVVTLIFLADGSATSLCFLAFGSNEVAVLAFLRFPPMVFPILISLIDGTARPICGSSDGGRSCIGLLLMLLLGGVMSCSYGKRSVRHCLENFEILLKINGLSFIP